MAMLKMDRHARNRMAVALATTYVISAFNHWSCEFESCPGDVYSTQHYV